MLVHNTNYHTADKIGSLGYEAGVAITTRSHHFPQETKFHVSPLFKEHQTFYDDVVSVCQSNSSYISKSGYVYKTPSDAYFT